MVFIGKGILDGTNVKNFFSTNENSHKKIFAIPRYVGHSRNNNAYETVRFSFDPVFDIKPKNLDGDKFIGLKNAKLVKKGPNAYQIIQSNTANERCMYAILREYTCIGHDLFIPVSSKKNINVIDCISFYTCEPDYGEYEARVYIVKITLKDDETLLIYSGNNQSRFQKHMAFYKEYNWSGKEKYAVEPNLTTLLSPGDFICLNDLISK